MASPGRLDRPPLSPCWALVRARGIGGQCRYGYAFQVPLLDRAAASSASRSLFLAMMFNPDKVDPSLRGVRGVGRVAGALARGRGDGRRDAPAAEPTVFAAVVVFVLALPFASVNGWWHVSNFGATWSNSSKQVMVATTALLELTAGAAKAVCWFHFVANGDGRRTARSTRFRARLAGIVQSPLAIATWLLVLFEVVSLTQAMISQYLAWSAGRSNLQALAGKTCGLAEDAGGSWIPTQACWRR